jgi:hypothetical protein
LISEACKSKWIPAFAGMTASERVALRATLH